MENGPRMGGGLRVPYNLDSRLTGEGTSGLGRTSSFYGTLEEKSLTTSYFSTTLDNERYPTYIHTYIRIEERTMIFQRI